MAYRKTKLNRDRASRARSNTMTYRKTKLNRDRASRARTALDAGGYEPRMEEESALAKCIRLGALHFEAEGEGRE